MKIGAFLRNNISKLHSKEIIELTSIDVYTYAQREIGM